MGFLAFDNDTLSKIKLSLPQNAFASKDAIWTTVSMKFSWSLSIISLVSLQ